MEDKIFYTLDNLELDETYSLLATNIDLNIDSKVMKRIRKSVYKKAGLKKSRNILKKVTTVAAAAVVLLMFSVVTMGVDNVASAFNRIFSFIPGYAIVENNKDIEYVIEGQKINAENSEVILNVNTAMATKDNISISFQLEKKNYIESKTIEEKQKELEEFKNGEHLNNLTILLHANGNEYKTASYVIGNGGKTDIISADFLVGDENINSQTTYRLDYKEYNISIAFKLKPYDSFNSLEEIGPTSTVNNISITAIPDIQDGKLEVELYPVNKSGYNITSYTKVYDTGYLGKDLYLQTNKGMLKYKTPGSSMGPNNKFYFDVSHNEKELVLKIPYLIVQSSYESQDISLKIPKVGEKLTVNKKVKFKDCTMLITQVERTNPDGNEYGALRMNFTYENKADNLLMCNTQIRRINLLGTTQGGGYSFAFDQNNIVKSIDFYLVKGENNLLRLKLEKPEYYLVGEYSLELK